MARSRWNKFLLQAVAGDAAIHPLAIQEGRTHFGARDTVRRFEDLETALSEAGVVIKALLFALQQKGVLDVKALVQALAVADVQQAPQGDAPRPPRGEARLCPVCKAKSPHSARACQFCGASF